jgi:transposase-like protein
MIGRQTESASSSAKPPRQSKKLALAANKSCDKPILDACVTTLMVFGRRDVYLPQNSDEMVPHCQEEFDAEDCVKNFARKCLSAFERQVAGMLILGAGQVLRKRCNQEGTKEYLSHYKCIKKTIPQLHDAMDQLIYTLMSISDEKDNDIKIPNSCCSFARFQELVNKIARFGCHEFDSKAEEYIGIKMVKGYVSDVLDLSCQGYDTNSDKCAKVKLPSGGFEWRNNTLVRLTNAKLPANKPNSVVWPFLNIFTNL